MMKNKILLFAGTTEGRKLAEFLNEHQIPAHVFAATEYGQSLIKESEYISVTGERLDLEGIKEKIISMGSPLVIDATHPFARVVTENIKDACRQLGVSYMRLLREKEEEKEESAVYVKDIEEAVSYLSKVDGKILATTGSKELAAYRQIPDYESRVYARVLSTAESISMCETLGFRGRHLIGMQGPFSTAMNEALLKEFDIRYLVTKESGQTGGFPEKCEAARRQGVKLVIIGRPAEEEGLSFPKTVSLLREMYGLEADRLVSIVGIGPGAGEEMTEAAKHAIKEADVLIGARRMIEAVAGKEKETYISYMPEEIVTFLKEHPEYVRPVIVFSGDLGFYSGSKKVLAFLREEGIPAEQIPGLSSLMYFATKLGICWEKSAFVSAHGRKANVAAHLRDKEGVFVLLGSVNEIRELGRELDQAGYGGCEGYLGVNLSYPTEKIFPILVKDLLQYDADPLAVLYLKGVNGAPVATHGLPDDSFIRGNVPMTKEEVRTVSISKLQLKKDAIVYDIGAGTGSVSLEMALRVTDGHVFAVETNPEGVALLETNRKKLGITNLTIVQALAPEGLTDLPAPDAVFIGGSKGNFAGIMEAVLEKTAHVRVVVNAITIETMAEVNGWLKEKGIQDTEITQLSVAKAKTLGDYHLMMGLNPVYIIRFTF